MPQSHASALPKACSVSARSNNRVDRGNTASSSDASLGSSSSDAFSIGSSTNLPSKHFTPTKGTLIALLLVSMLNCMGGAAVAPALPQISAAFPDAAESIVALIISLPSLAVVLSGFFVGAIADKMGKAKTLFASLALFTVAGLSGIVLPTLETILVSRFVMGLGMAGVATSSTALIADYYDADQQAKVMGMQSAATGASILILEMTGGFLALLGWRVPFYVYAIGIVMLVFVGLYVREPYRKSAEARSIAETDSDSENSAKTASSAEAATAKGITAVCAICFIAVFLNSLVVFLVPSKMPYLVEMFGGNTATSGLFLGAFGLANIVSALAYARLIKRFRRFALLGVSFLFAAIGTLCIGLASSLWPILVGAVLVNLGVGIIMPLMANWLGQVATPQNSGRIMGTYAAMLNLGQFFSPLLAGILLAQTDSYSALFMAGAIIPAALAVFCFAARAVAPGLQNVRARD